MVPKLILMFTLNDMTVPDALDYFEQIKDLPVDFFGFKELGLEPQKMQELNNRIHSAGFKSFLEVVEYDEDKILGPAQQAVDMGFDYLMGTIYFPSIWDIVGKGANKKINYFPFFGKIYDRPSVLDGSIEEIVAEGKKLIEEGADGFDLLLYRYKYPEKIDELISRVVKEVNAPVVSAGSINSYERLQATIDQKVWGFTIGGAFFEKKFAPEGTYRDNVKAVVDYLKKADKK
ncbi:MAG: beta/alpha barrel domain-containing protein [Candidatus Humimicrobiaceae bacterium]